MLSSNVFLRFKKKKKTDLTFFYATMYFVTNSIDKNSAYHHLRITEDIPALFTIKTDNIILKSKYFSNVPEVAWNFYIGGYQPAQKWLKDRKDRELSYEDILHYQKIILALTETDRIMRDIDAVRG